MRQRGGLVWIWIMQWKKWTWNGKKISIWICFAISAFQKFARIYSVDVNLLLNLIELCTILTFPFFLFLWKNIHPTSRSLGHWGPAKSHIVQEIEILSDNPTNYHMCFITFVFEMFHSGKFEFQSKLILQ